MPRFQAVLFDMGHTLVYRDGEAALVVAAAADLGVDLDPGEAADLWAEMQAEARTPGAMARGRDLSEAAHRREWLRLLAPADAVVPGLAERLYRHERDPGTWRLYPDVVEVLDALATRQVALGVVSDTGWDYTEVLALTGVRDRFASFVLSFEHGVIKPDPSLFLTACRELGVDPVDALMVGDNHVPDGGAVAAGLTVLLLPPVPAGATRGLRSVVALVDG